MSLVVHPMVFEKDGQIALATQNRITAEIEMFWNGKCSDQHIFVNIAN
jgi:hypothetical protein